MIDTNNLKEVEKMVFDLFDEHNIRHCTFKINNRLTRSLGRALNDTELELSGSFASYGIMESIRMVLLHEIAHILDYKERGKSAHDYKFAVIAERIGTTLTGATVPPIDLYRGDYNPSKYKAICPVCGHVHYKNRISRRLSSCSVCANYFSGMRILNYRPNN